MKPTVLMCCGSSYVHLKQTLWTHAHFIISVIVMISHIVQTATYIGSTMDSSSLIIAQHISSCLSRMFACQIYIQLQMVEQMLNEQTVQHSQTSPDT